MKNIILLAFVFSVGFASAQEFKETNKYALSNQRTTSQEEENSGVIDLVLAEDTSTTITTLPITDFGMLERVQISTLTNPHLEGVNEVLKVVFEYSFCCSNTEEYYFLVSNDQDVIALPHIENEYGYDPIEDIHYIFPSMSFGEAGTILRAELKYTESYTIKEIKVLQSFVWNDDDFGTEDARIAIN